MRVFTYNVSYAVRLLLLFPLTLVASPLLLTGHARGWLRNLTAWWSLALPPACGVLVYCLVFLDKRYVAGYLVLLWLSLLCTLHLNSLRLTRMTSLVLQMVHVLLLFVLIAYEFRAPVRLAWTDLIHRAETNRNLHALLADRFRELGLEAGDKIAYLGVTFNADWTRLDDVRITGEIPVTYVRHWKLFSSNVSHDDDTALGAFWHAGPDVQGRLLDQFRRAGIRMAVTDGSFAEEAAAQGWSLALSPAEPGLPQSDGQQQVQIHTRYLWLEKDSPNKTSR